MAATMILQVLLLVCLLTVLPPLVRAQPGSRHIACGATEGFTDTLGVTWETDAAYIATGAVGTPKDWKLHYPLWPELQYNRHFPSARGKHCFTLPVTPGATYILRAGFMYGYYDNAATGSKYPTFQVALDSSMVENVTLPKAYSIVFRELTFRATRNETSFCLVRDPSQAVPFINTLALRPVPTGLPAPIIERVGINQSVSTMARIQFHRDGDSLISYNSKNSINSDLYDRYWISTNGTSQNNYPMTTASQFTSTAPLEFPVTNSSVSVVSSATALATGIPQGVLRGAVTTAGNLTISLNTTVPFKAYIQYYFVELDELVNVTDRMFVVESPGADPYAISVTNFTNGPLVLWIVKHADASIELDSKIVMYRNPASTSLRGPIISALEVFKIDNPAVPPTNDRDYDAIRAINSEMLLKSWGGDPCLPVPHEWLTCKVVPLTQADVTAVLLSGYNLTSTISPAFNQLLSITSLDLSNNFLTGPIPDLRALKNLKTLHLQNNNLTGPLPAWLGSLPLQELFVQNNDLSGEFPPEFKTKNWNFTYSGNPKLVIGSPSKSTNIGVIIGAVVGAVVVIGIIACLVCFMCRRRRRQNKSPHPDDQARLPITRNPPPGPSTNATMPNSGAKAYSLAEIDAATAHYKTEIGKGGFGPVYYGKMADGKEVAVKELDTTSKQGESEFFNEVDILSRVHHRHLVSLVGYCRAGGKLMLVYEYIHKGSLRDHLDGDTSKVGSIVLDWKTRLNIGLQAALGLEYLHTGCNPSLIHRDVKSANILITSNNEAKVADFGLSRLVGEDDDSQVLTMVKGTPGYLDPEYYLSNHLSPYSDVYSFGVVLLELITGRVPISKSVVPNEVNPTLVDWVRSSLLAGDISAIIDPKLRASRPNHDSLWKVAEIALRSVEPKSAHRPTMNEVVQELLGAVALEKDAGGSWNSAAGAPPPPPPPRFHSRTPSGYSEYASDSNVQFGLDSASYPAPR